MRGQSLLSSGVEITGSVTFANELMIDGKLEGEIISTGALTIGENADIRGEIISKSVAIYGSVRGVVTAPQRCTLKSQCVLHGNLRVGRLVIEDGATFVGTCEVGETLS